MTWAAAILIALVASPRPLEEKVLLGLIQAHGAWLLDGYQMPTADDMKHDWAVFGDYVTDPPHRISADFNGDGSPDHAFILLSSVGYGVRLAALVSRGAEFRPLKLLEFEAGNIYSQHRYIVGVVPPGPYKTAAGKGYFEVDEENPAELVLSNPAIDFIYTESANSYLYWDEESGRFRQVQISD